MRFWNWVGATLVFAVLFGACRLRWGATAVAYAQGASPHASLPSSRGWPLVHGDLGNTRYSPLDQINRGNVHLLGGAWKSPPFEDGAQSRSTPVVHGDLMLMTAGARIYAIDVRTGKFVWQYRSDARKAPAGLETTRGQAEVLGSGGAYALPNSQGVAVGDGLVFAGLTDGRIIALEESTGRLRWSHQLGDDPPRKGQSASAAPVFANGVIFAGLANADFGLRGGIFALDAKTGRELWHFSAVPGPGEFGHSTWPANSDIWKRGGGGVWNAGVVDPELGLVYFAPGNTVPQTGGEAREGDNLFTDSVVALDIKTGKLRWYYQGIHHDLWDADGFAPTPLVLYEARVGDIARKGIAAMRADGYLFLLDRETGKPLIPVEERPVPQNPQQKTAKTQPFPVGAQSILPPCSEWSQYIPEGFQLGCTYTPHYLDKQNILAPGFGVRVSPMSYSPQTGYFYAQGSDGLASRRRISTDPWFFTVAGTLGSVALLDLPRQSLIAAVDSRTDKIVWRKEVASAGLSRTGMLSTAGGLVFFGNEDGNFQALDATTGDLLWQFQTGSPPRPASTYEIDGEQYVALSTGSTVWAFKLGGKLPPAAPPKVASNPSLPPPTDADHIETASLARDMGINGQRYATDEYTFSPTRARVKAGSSVTWTNNGQLLHTITAQDGSWTTGTLQPAQEVTLRFTKPGTYTYFCKEHPWSIGQLIVTAEFEESTPPVNPAAGGPNNALTQQVTRGQQRYLQHCSSCHLENLNGNGAAPPLVGPSFLANWQGRTIADLFSKIRTTMPQTSPGSLSQDVYLDILTFLLRSNGSLPSGISALKPDSATMDRTISK